MLSSRSDASLRAKKTYIIQKKLYINKNLDASQSDDRIEDADKIKTSIY